ncbi:hypothetical protein [Streptomyces canus]|uniref:hypothetical protein n=1 Tax=Streptomyces canus TaxID=58343 RepID=UPI00386B9C28
MALRADRQAAAEHGHRITAAIACHVARADGTVDQLTQLLLHPEHEGGRHAEHIALRSGQARALVDLESGSGVGVFDDERPDAVVTDLVVQGLGVALDRVLGAA